MPHFARRTANVATVVADMIYVGVRKIKIKTTLHASSYPLRKPLNSLAHLKHVRTNVIQATGESHATKK